MSQKSIVICSLTNKPWRLTVESKLGKRRLFTIDLHRSLVQ
ncbi:hypothetical protein ACO0LD_07375 [Undibacterium sp. Ji83W]